MVFNGSLVVSVANSSADIWQYMACFPEHISSQRMLDLVCCFPLEQLGRLVMHLWTYLCFYPPDSYYYTYDSDSSSSSTDYELDDDSYYDSHSD